MKENERNLLAAQLCSAFCFCCYSNRDVEVKLSDAYLHGRTGRVFFLSISRTQPATPVTQIQTASTFNIIQHTEEMEYQDIEIMK